MPTPHIPKIAWHYTDGWWGIHSFTTEEAKEALADRPEQREMHDTVQQLVNHDPFVAQLMAFVPNPEKKVRVFLESVCPPEWGAFTRVEFLLEPLSGIHLCAQKAGHLTVPLKFIHEMWHVIAKRRFYSALLASDAPFEVPLIGADPLEIWKGVFPEGAFEEAFATMLGIRINVPSFPPMGVQLIAGEDAVLLSMWPYYEYPFSKKALPVVAGLICLLPIAWAHQDAWKAMARTVLSHDNGRMDLHAFLSYLASDYPALAPWIPEACKTPNE